MDTPSKKISLPTITIVFILSFFTLTLELVLSRMSAFYLNYSNAFLAIPIALFGLAIGSLHIHQSKQDIDSFSISKNLLGLSIFSFISFGFVFLLFSRFFLTIPITHQNIIDWMTPIKTAVFSGVFTLPFYFIGKIFTILFTKNRNAIGRLYGVDLIGAAIGCLSVPIAFHFLDLPYIISFCLLIISILAAYVRGKNIILSILVLLIINIAMLQAIIFLESNYDMGNTVYRLANRAKIEEKAHRWNEFSRVSLLKINNRGHVFYRIIHDNAESNVGVASYAPSKKRSYKRHPDWLAIPFLFERNTKNILVMFAGCGKQMTQFHDYSAGQSHITGVEINPLVKEFAIDSPELRNFRLKTFYDLPNIDLVIQEGRYFLENDKTKYNVIYVGSDAATALFKTGHSRKYLDTYEAMLAYIDHLEHDGLLIFHAQPSVNKLYSLKRLFSERSILDFDKCVIVLSQDFDRSDYLIVSLKPFSSGELETVKRHFKRDIFYLPGYSGNRVSAGEIIHSDLSGNNRLVTDDRPYIRTIDFVNYKLFPSLRRLANHHYYKSWIKITTLLIAFGVLFLIIFALFVSNANMPPVYIVVYLFITGFSYMLIEITFIARLELFLGNPLLSMSLLLFIFLTSNSMGSRLLDKLRTIVNIDLLPLFTVVIILVTVWAMGLVISNFKGLHLVLRVFLTVLIISPAAFCLGLFYPYAVTWLSNRNMAQAIPITYGLSTLSSVAGATYAMTMIINFGYTQVIFQAVIGYLILLLLTMGYYRFVQLQ
jgi:hypothetical protein